MATMAGYTGAGILNMVHGTACGVHSAQSSSDCMGQLSPLLSTLPAVQVVTATGRGHHAAHIGRRETIVAHAEALVHASQMHCAHEACKLHGAD